MLSCGSRLQPQAPCLKSSPVAYPSVLRAEYIIASRVVALALYPLPVLRVDGTRASVPLRPASVFADVTVILHCGAPRPDINRSHRVVPCSRSRRSYDPCIIIEAISERIACPRKGSIAGSLLQRSVMVATQLVRTVDCSPIVPSIRQPIQHLISAILGTREHTA